MIKPAGLVSDSGAPVPSPVYSRERVRVRAGDTQCRSVGNGHPPGDRASTSLRRSLSPALTLTLSRAYTGEGTKRVLTVLALLAVAGCAAKPDPIPHYDYTDADTARTILRTRLKNLRTVRGEATITLTDAKGQTVRLDAAYALQPPGRAHLRAWKFGQAVFDLTLRDGEAWAYLPREETKPAAPNLRRSLGRWLELIADDAVFRDPIESADNRNVYVSSTQPDGTHVDCRIDRATVTPRQYTLCDDKGVERFSLALSDYRQYADDQVWPTTIIARSAQGTFEVHAAEVEVNVELPEATFKPPSRAEKLP